MGSLRWNGVRFFAYPNDHLPRHVHGFTGNVEVIVELHDGREVRIADRANAIKPGNAMQSDVKKVLRNAAHTSMN